MTYEEIIQAIIEGKTNESIYLQFQSNDYSRQGNISANADYFKNLFFTELRKKYVVIEKRDLELLQNLPKLHEPEKS